MLAWAKEAWMAVTSTALKFIRTLESDPLKLKHILRF
jgi:hypothetical protein